MGKAQIDEIFPEKNKTSEGLIDLEKEDLDRCVQYFASRHQRDTERRRGLDPKGVEGYETRGCYNCEGFDRYCETYISFSDIRN